jgi:hypothetical protein
VDIPEGLLDLLYRPSPCYLATTMGDGSPHLTQIWVDTDGKHILVNSVQGFQKIKNIYAVRGRVLDITSDGAAEHIEMLAQRYLGGPYPWYGGRDQTRLLLTIEVLKVNGTG